MLVEEHADYELRSLVATMTELDGLIMALSQTMQDAENRRAAATRRLAELVIQREKGERKR